MTSLTLQELGLVGIPETNSDTIPNNAKPFEHEDEKLWVSPSQIASLKEHADISALDHLVVTGRIDLQNVLLFSSKETPVSPGVFLEALRQSGETHLLIPDFRKQCANLVCLSDLQRGKDDALCLGSNGVIHYKHANPDGHDEYHPIGKGNDVLTLSSEQ